MVRGCERLRRVPAEREAVIEAQEQRDSSLVRSRGRGMMGQILKILLPSACMLSDIKTTCFLL